MRVDQLFRLDGRTAIVTGGAGLYGRLIARALAEAGASVVIASRDEARCEQAAAELREEGMAAIGLALDLEDERSIGELVAAVLRRYGRLDVLVNNAVSRTGLADLEQTDKRGWETAQAINGAGLMLMTQAAVAPMREQGGGSIVNIASIQGAVGPNFPVYGDTGMSSGVEYTYAKWGMVGFTKWVANYYGGCGIRANAISPGGYNPGLASDPDKAVFLENYKRLTPLGRMAEDDDIKGPVVFFASDASRYVTGQNVPVDGGWTSW
ncbi:SDR family oxidoreductase [Paenibacillus sp. IB182496]|uniref:SDR family oxidoreductase n=1 Tax=Paenibacillus sabuli TaxID=2772509 RepID=A0A927BZK3_9BACL|nr:SDR family oxidoreductase [Paenibacillus sabuli]MBD2848274.1 SDR family oxidoreductase [Paenibacillus sabuli]